MIEYPKIETLYSRDPDTFGVIPEQMRCPEFKLIKRWIVTEKVDGTNVRVRLASDGGNMIVLTYGRTSAAQLHPKLTAYLHKTFTVARFEQAIEPKEDGSLPNVVLYGEGYGPKIQSGGKYRADQSFILFDVMIDNWWLNWPDVVDVGRKMEIDVVPFLGDRPALPTSRDHLDTLMPRGSHVAHVNTGKKIEPEGIVARTDPLLFTRQGKRLMWKLKYKDFRD